MAVHAIARHGLTRIFRHEFHEFTPMKMDELLYKEEVFQLVGVLHGDSPRVGKGPRRSHLQGRARR